MSDHVIERSSIPNRLIADAQGSTLFTEEDVMVCTVVVVTHSLTHSLTLFAQPSCPLSRGSPRTR